MRFALPQRLDKMVYVATTIWFFAAVNVMKIIPYFALGQFSTSGLTTSVALFPLAIASNFLGIWLVRITPNELFYRITYGSLLLSLELTRRGLFGLSGRPNVELSCATLAFVHALMRASTAGTMRETMTS
jgi:uncharacterized membrane protein YfcA